MLVPCGQLLWSPPASTSVPPESAGLHLRGGGRRRPSKGGCPFVFDPTTGEFCKARTQTKVSNGLRYCKHHAGILDKRGSKAVCPYNVDGNLCRARTQATAPDGIRYCKHHAGFVDGKTMRLKRAPPQRLVHIGNLKRCRFKQPDPRERKRLCDMGGCLLRARQAQGTLRLCDFQARQQPGTRVAAVVMTLENYTDIAVELFRLGNMTVQCSSCHSMNFKEELVGRPPHFNICCQNGVVSQDTYVYDDDSPEKR